MTPEDSVTKSECELRCGAYKSELESIDAELHVMESRIIDVQRWQAEHDGRINAWWEQQFRVNQSFEKRLVAVERKVIWASGFAAGIGALTGGMITRLLGVN